MVREVVGGCCDGSAAAGGCCDGSAAAGGLREARDLREVARVVREAARVLLEGPAAAEAAAETSIDGSGSVVASESYG